MAITFKESRGIPVNGSDVTQQVAESAIQNEVPETIETVPDTVPDTVNDTVPDTVQDTIDFDFGDEPQAEQPQPAPMNWQDAIKSADRNEVLKAIGMDWALNLDDFDKEFSTARKSGIDPYKYLEAKAVDWNKVPEETLLKEDIAKQYPGATPEDLDFLYSSKYVRDDMDDEMAQRIKEIARRSDVARIRANKTEESKNFSIPANTQSQVSKESVMAEIQQEVAANSEKYRQDVLQSPEIKNLVDTKQIVLDMNDLGKLKFGVKNPNEVVSFINDGNTYRKHTLDAQGKPDMQKAIWTAVLNIVGPSNFLKIITDNSKRLASKEVLEEGRNITGIKSPQPGTPTDGKITFRSGRGIH